MTYTDPLNLSLVLCILKVSTPSKQTYNFLLYLLLIGSHHTNVIIFIFGND
jgi:hypothetical protein